ncbi:MAG: polysaccharide deacetylase [Chloroflexi bacterium]|nr:polysaccharide deacetylase [Chloroflexota bacterium]
MWSNGKRCAVVLTWNFDAEAMWFGALEMDSPGSMERGAYGARAGFERVMNLLDSYKVPGTFFVPAWVALNHRAEVERAMELGQEVAYEGFNCESVIGMSVDEERGLIRRSLKALEEVTGSRPRGARVVPWDHNLHTAKLLLEEGFVYDSSLMGDDNPYLIDVEGMPEPLIQLPVSWELDDFPFSAYFFGGSNVMLPPDDILSLWQTEFDKAYEEGGMFLITLHPQLIGRRSRIGVLERLIEHMKGRDGVWFATALDAAQGWREPRRVSWPPVGPST